MARFIVYNLSDGHRLITGPYNESAVEVISRGKLREGKETRTIVTARSMAVVEAQYPCIKCETSKRPSLEQLI